MGSISDCPHAATASSLGPLQWTPTAPLRLPQTATGRQEGQVSARYQEADSRLRSPTLAGSQLDPWTDHSVGWPADGRQPTRFLRHQSSLLTPASWPGATVRPDPGLLGGVTPRGRRPRRDTTASSTCQVQSAIYCWDPRGVPQDRPVHFARHHHHRRPYTGADQASAEPRPGPGGGGPQMGPDTPGCTRSQCRFATAG